MASLSRAHSNHINSLISTTRNPNWWCNTISQTISHNSSNNRKPEEPAERGRPS
ncbi:hypothetical protein PCASD_06701 [Puccinia coronata f. sp. avenae]|uniref:Uncharacterized protein n=1 Tax=Puccinia coronata f. sp. avenae TaxID=200324 RepID=A0A2N5TF40_9BASI|nr:hypothetical protein PCASD_06701 [Puccinia coronata f. sp. avenae]